MVNLSGSWMDEKVPAEGVLPAETVLLGREFQWSMTREKKENFEEFNQADRKFTEHGNMATSDVKSPRSEVD